MIKKCYTPPYTINADELKRFPQRQIVFGRMMYDPNADFYQQEMYDRVPQNIDEKGDGYSHIDYARALAAWTVHDYFHDAFSEKKLEEPFSVMNKPKLRQHPVIDPDEMSVQIKDTAKMYGASLVGITQLNHSWLYSHDLKKNPIIIPNKYRYAIVIAVAMNLKNIETSPSQLACTETGLGYSRMAFCASSLAEFIRYLGYDAISIGNSTGLSIPLAIDAGLGELGRNGLLVTPEFGSCVRLCKVFTNLPLSPDKPIEFGVTDFCKKCKKCAEACHADAIQAQEAPSFDVVCPSNNPGILRWAVNHDKCYQFWVENGGECSNCIKVCPFVRRNAKSFQSIFSDT